MIPALPAASSPLSPDVIFLLLKACLSIREGKCHVAPAPPTRLPSSRVVTDFEGECPRSGSGFPVKLNRSQFWDLTSSRGGRFSYGIQLHPTAVTTKTRPVPADTELTR